MLKLILVKWFIGLGIIMPHKDDNRNISNRNPIPDSPVYQTSGKEKVKEQKEIAYEEVND